jgi:hypothetical protein
MMMEDWCRRDACVAQFQVLTGWKTEQVEEALVANGRIPQLSGVRVGLFEQDSET